MHKIQAKEFTIDDFSHEHLNIWSMEELRYDIERLNSARNVYLNGGHDYDEEGNLAKFQPKSKYIWWQMIQLLPSSYNQKRTVLMNYEMLANAYKSRTGHKLDEWSMSFVDWIESLPHCELITGDFKD